MGVSAGRSLVASRNCPTATIRALLSKRESVSPMSASRAALYSATARGVSSGIGDAPPEASSAYRPVVPTRWAAASRTVHSELTLPAASAVGRQDLGQPIGQSLDGRTRAVQDLGSVHLRLHCPLLESPFWGFSR